MPSQLTNSSLEEHRELRFGESNFKNLEGNMPPDPPRSWCLKHSMFAPMAQTVQVRQLNLYKPEPAQLP